MYKSSGPMKSGLIVLRAQRGGFRRRGWTLLDTGVTLNYEDKMYKSSGPMKSGLIVLRAQRGGFRRRGWTLLCYGRAGIKTLRFFKSIAKT